MQLFIQMVYARDCNLNNNSVIQPETICAAAEWPSLPLLRKGYISIENYQRQAPVPCSNRGAFTNRNGPERTGMDLHNRNGPQNLP